MRYQGKISAWNAERGFGFIVWNGGGEKIFVHVSQLSHKRHVPEVGDVVTYELGLKDEKGQKAVNVIFPGLAPVREKRRKKESDHSFGFSLLIPILLIAGGLYWWFGVREPEPETIAPVQIKEAKHFSDNSSPAPSKTQFSCEGKTHCSQMSSCAEATFYIQHCPNTEMDGNHDGVPCESQWCN